MRVSFGRQYFAVADHDLRCFDARGGRTAAHDAAANAIAVACDSLGLAATREPLLIDAATFAGVPEPVVTAATPMAMRRGDVVDVQRRSDVLVAWPGGGPGYLVDLTFWSQPRPVAAPTRTAPGHSEVTVPAAQYTVPATGSSAEGTTGQKHGDFSAHSIAAGLRPPN